MHVRLPSAMPDHPSGPARPLMAVLIVGCVSSLLPNGGPAADVPAEAPRAPASWSRLEFVAKKGSGEATIAIRLEVLSSAEASKDLVPAGLGTPVMPRGGDVVFVESTASLASKVFADRIWFDPESGAASQITDIETGSRPHQKIYRLSREGYTLDQREPASSNESGLSPDLWTKRKQVSAAYPFQLPARAVVTAPSGLLYEASVVNLKSPGQWLIRYTLVHEQLERIAVHVGALEPLAVDFQVEDGDGVRQVGGTVQALRASVRSDVLGPDGASVFHFFGLENNLELLWDPELRIPLELTGEIRLLGRFEVKLVKATMRSGA